MFQLLLFASCTPAEQDPDETGEVEDTDTDTDTDTEGTYDVGVFLDHEEALAELDEDNNVDFGGGLTEVEVGDWPDLAIGYFYAEVYTLEAGDRTEVHWEVDNLGTERTYGDWNVAFYLSSDGLFSADDLLLREETTTTILSEDDYTRSSGNWYITAPSPATTTSYTLLLVVDPGRLVDEQDESNNTLAASELLVVTAEPTWDVEVQSVATAEYTVVEADTISYAVDLANNGNTDTSSFSLSLVYSTDTTIDATDTDETNNTGYDATAVAVTPAHWDLVPSNAGAADTTVDWGDSVAFTYDVTNSGTTDLSGFEVGLYYSTNTAIATTDDLICTDTVSSTLAAGATAAPATRRSPRRTR